MSLSETPALKMRMARPGDAVTVAALHAASWRTHYRGTFSDAYLDGPIEAERLGVWTARLAHPRAGQITILALDGEHLAGFVCVFVDHDRHAGSLIDNLHVAAAGKRRGLGRRLLNEAGGAMLHAPPQRPAYLFVLESNRAARAFYDAVGGTVVEHLRKEEVDGGEYPVLRYAWPSPSALIAATS